MQIVIGLAITVFPAVTAAFALGLVGREDLSKRIAQNESFTDTGKLVFAIGAGMIGTFLALQTRPQESERKEEQQPTR